MYRNYEGSCGKILILGKRSINVELIACGLAWVYRRYSNTAELIELETVARKKKLGLWHAGDAAPPWEFRKKRKK